jgi:hypothetical protein
MFKDRDVLIVVCDFLQQKGYVSEKRWPSSGTIVAINSDKGERFLINAYPEHADAEATRACVAYALYEAACRLYEAERRKGDIIAVVFPYNSSFWENLQPLKKALHRLAIACYLVRPNRSVLVFTEGTPRSGPLLVP